jgi:hypothetical protein
MVRSEASAGHDRAVSNPALYNSIGTKGLTKTWWLYWSRWGHNTWLVYSASCYRRHGEMVWSTVTTYHHLNVLSLYNTSSWPKKGSVNHLAGQFILMHTHPLRLSSALYNNSPKGQYRLSGRGVLCSNGLNHSKTPWLHLFCLHIWP